MEDNVSTEGEENNINVRNGQGVGDPENEEDSDEEEQQFDISLAASHSYMGNSLTAVSGRSILEPGWEGEVPVIAHHGTVFPGETVPMLLTNPHDAEIITRAIQQDKLFGLLCPDETGTLVSGYGVLCEVFEVGGEDGALSFKARATHRVRCPRLRRAPAHQYARMRPAAVRVLPELRRGDPLRLTRLAGLAARRPRPAARRLDAALTPWPPFVYDMLDYRRLRAHIQDYFRTMALENVPEEPVSLSFWTASNLALSARDRLALFVVDDALLRLHMEVRLITRKSVLCCSSCAIEIARREHIFAMSSEGVHSNYTNLGGYMHDIVTVSRAVNTELSGAPSAEFSWFPGYAWSVALCAACMAHVGWRFDAQRRALRPQRFYGLCRNYVTPRCDGDRTPPSRTPPPPPPDAPVPAPAAALAAALSALGPSPRDDDDDDDHSA